MRVLNTMCMILRDVLMEYQWCHTASTKVNKLQRNTTKSRQTNSTYTAQRTAAYARVHTDNKSNTHGRSGNSPNAEQFSNNKIKITRKQTRDERSAVRSPCGPRSDNIPDSISDSHTPRLLDPDYQQAPQTQAHNSNCCAAQR